MWNIQELVIYVDDALLVINKPAGLLSLPDGYDLDLPHLRSVLEPQFGRLWIVHRLDKQTSGVIVLARTKTAHRSLNNAFADRTTSKTYHALVAGEPTWQERTVHLPLLPNGDRRHRTVVHEKRGKPSLTHIRVLARFRQYALLQAVPETGRTHQIRVHLTALGFPIIADALYGNWAKTTQQDLPLNRLGLHAKSIHIEHPITKKATRFDAPYPQDFSATLHKLEDNDDN